MNEGVIEIVGVFDGVLGGVPVGVGVLDLVSVGDIVGVGDFVGDKEIVGVFVGVFEGVGV